MKVVYTYFGLMQRVGGVSRYYFELISRIRGAIKVNVCSFFLSNEYFKAFLRRIWFSPKKRFGIYTRLLVEEVFQFVYLLLGRYDIIHLTAESITPFMWSRKPVVITIHDMIPELFSTNQRVVARRRIAINRSDAIICVSENTKTDLLRLFPEIPKDKVTVTYHGYTPFRFEYKRIIEGDYILYVGARTAAYKNFRGMLRAICPVLLDSNIRLVCTGSPFSAEELELLKELSLEEVVINVGYVTDEPLASLYHFAVCFIYPSLYEGFGIPILEAWNYQCPVCLSNASCFPEIGGDAVCYFDPNSSDQILNAVVRIVSDVQYRSSLIEKGCERLQLFSWDKAADKTIEIYKGLVR